MQNINPYESGENFIMKKVFISLCLTTAVFFAGCGKKADKSGAVKVAHQEIPIYQYEEDKFFDDDELGEFAFIDGDGKEVSKVSTESVDNSGQGHTVASYDDWDDDELPLAWKDEDDGETAFKTVNFDLNRNAIRKDQVIKVAHNVKAAQEVVKTGKQVVVAGHTCPIGSASYNMSLSERRAKTIRDEMVKSGVPADRVKILGCGSEIPIVLSDAADRAEMIKELAPNRRAEVSAS